MNLNSALVFTWMLILVTFFWIINPVAAIIYPSSYITIQIGSINCITENRRDYEGTRDELSFELLTLLTDGRGYIGGALIKDSLEDIGIKITHTQQDPSVILPKLHNYGYYENSTAYDLDTEPINNIRPYDLVYMSLNSDPLIPTDLARNHAKEDYPGGRNEWAIHNQTLNQHIDFMDNTSMELVKYHNDQQQAILAEECPYIQVLYQSDVLMARKGITGFVSTPKGVISNYNHLTTLNLHNTTKLPVTRNGTELIISFSNYIQEGNAEGMLYYESITFQTAYVDSLLWEPLVIVNETGHIIPWLAESYSISSDWMTYSFKLRDGVLWHDGQLLTPEDVKFSFDYIKEHETEATWSSTTYIDNCTISAEGIIKFTMGEFNWRGIYGFLDLLIFPQHIFGTHTIYNHPSWHDLTNMTTKIGSGPYIFEEVDTVSTPTRWTFKRNPNYWFTGVMHTTLDKTVALGGSVPYYPRMDHLTIQVKPASLLAIEKGEVDFTPDEITIWTTVENVYEAYAPSTWCKTLLINNAISPLNDKRVRQALAYAIDYRAIVESAEDGNAIPLYNQYLPRAYYPDWHNLTTDIYYYNITKANQILDEAGYLDFDSDGIREIPQGDLDRDGMPNFWEYQMGLNATNAQDATQDKDMDGLPNLWEYQMGLNATNAQDATQDADGDGLPNLWEYQMNLNATLNDAAEDVDGDGLTNLQEYQFGTHPRKVDTDGDKLPDFYEFKYDLNGTSNDAADDSDGDGLTNLQEYKHGTDPHDRDSDNDFFPDGMDYGWMGNPRTNWDNPVTRGLFLSLLVGLLGVGVWAGFVAKKLPQLQQDLKRQFQQFQQLTRQFQETLKTIKALESVEEVETAAAQLYQDFQDCEESYLLAQQYIKPHWLPSFLRPDLTPWESLFIAVQQNYEEFQQTRIKRLDAKY